MSKVFQTAPRPVLAKRPGCLDSEAVFWRQTGSGLLVVMCLGARFGTLGGEIEICEKEPRDCQSLDLWRATVKPSGETPQPNKEQTSRIAIGLPTRK